MLVVLSGDILLTGNITFRQDGIDIVETAVGGARLNQSRLKLDLTQLGQIDLPKWTKYAVFVNRVDVAHGDNPQSFAVSRPNAV